MTEYELVSLRELARRTGVCPRTVRAWRDRDGLPVYEMSPKLHVVIMSEFDQWLRIRRVSHQTAPH